MRKTKIEVMEGMEEDKKERKKKRKVWKEHYEKDKYMMPLEETDQWKRKKREDK